MKLAIDNDFFCKSELLGIAEQILGCLGTSRSESRLVPSLIAQLQTGRGKLCRHYAPHVPFLHEQAKLYALAEDPGTEWADRMRDVAGLDPGEVRLLALAVENDAILMATHDKVCLRAIPKVPGLVSALNGKVILLEYALLELCNAIGKDELHRLASPHVDRVNDQVCRVCFGGSVNSLVDGLQSYVADLRNITDPSIFWLPSLIL